MTLEILEHTFAVCSLPNLSLADNGGEIFFSAKTDKEYSLVCECGRIPENALKVEKSWRGFRVSGVLDFSLVGILSEIAGILAEAKISIFAVSTFDTDYILIKEESFQNAVSALKAAGYEFKRKDE